MKTAGFNYFCQKDEDKNIMHINSLILICELLSEQSIRGFCIGKKNWVMIDTIAGAKSSAIIYSIAETAKANNLKPYDYFEYLLTEIPKHMDDKNLKFCEELLP